MTVDDITTDSPQFTAFISGQFTKHTTKLRGQITQLQEQMTPDTKNRDRGATTSSVLCNKNQKKTNRKDVTPSTPRNRSKTQVNGQKANAVANNSSDPEQKPGKGRQNKKKVSFANSGTQSQQK
jgi:hypothetical protein